VHEDGYRVTLAPGALRDLNQLPPRAAAAVIEFIAHVLPDHPRRVGKPLRQGFEGLYSARRGDYRVLYDIIPSDRVILVIRVDHRAKAYRRR